MRTLAIFLFALVAVCVALPASAADRLVPDSAARLRIVSRSALTFVVEVTNSSDDPTRFDAVGLYFLPDGSEPQRLGVINAPDVATLAPHTSITLTLQTYCLDEHRAGPTDATHYQLASRRMPTALTSALAVAARGTAPQNVQQTVWRIRETMPVTLIGDTGPAPVKPANAVQWDD